MTIFCYLLINLIFAGLYLIFPGAIEGARPGNLLDVFFFSIETLATVGYGVMHPVTLIGHLLSMLEILVGIFITAVTTGLVFARFSRPRAKLLYSNVAVTSPLDGVESLMVRVASHRHQAIAEATARLTVIKRVMSQEGIVTRRLFDLKLLRDHSPAMSLSWTLVHPITEDSPLYDLSHEEMIRDDLSLILSINGYDEAISAPIIGRKTYRAENIFCGHRFSDIMDEDEDGNLVMHLGRFHDVVKL